MNKQFTNVFDVTEEDYINWCKDNKKKAYKKTNKIEFFSKIQEGKLIKDSKTGRIVKKSKNEEHD